MSAATAIAPPPGAQRLPPYDGGWVLAGDAREPFLSYVDADPSVNWSDELESLHEESSRSHFLDQWTRAAVVSRVGELTAGATIADIGSSTGYLLEDLAEAFADATLIGVDLVSAGLRKAHAALPDALLLHADACALPLADASLDAVVSANLLEHIPDDRRALAEIARVLKPGARAVVVVPAGPSNFDYYDRFLGHERRYGRHELAQKGLEAGLEVLEDTYIAALLYPAFWLVKQRNRRHHGALAGPALEHRVAADIARTRDSVVGRRLWALEERLRRAGVKLPFGVRSLVVFRRRGEEP
jgi:SAM-dependent methyltransferase